MKDHKIDSPRHWGLLGRRFGFCARRFLVVLLVAALGLAGMVPALQAQEKKGAKKAENGVSSPADSGKQQPAPTKDEKANEGDASEVKLIPKVYGNPIQPLLDAHAYAKSNPDKSVRDYLVSRCKYLIDLITPKLERPDLAQASKVLTNVIDCVSPHSQLKNPTQEHEVKVVISYLKTNLDILATDIEPKIKKLDGLLNTDMKTSLDIYFGTITKEEDIAAARKFFFPSTDNKRIDGIIKVLCDASIAEMHIFHNVDNPNWLYELQQKQLQQGILKITKDGKIQSPPRAAAKEEPAIPLKDLGPQQ